MPVGGSVLTAAVAAALACLVWPDLGGDGGAAASSSDGARTARSHLSRGLAAARRPMARSPDEAWVADFAEVVAVGLDAGLDLPAAALASALSPGVTASAPWLAPHLRSSLDAGRGVTTVLEGSPGLADETRRDLSLLVAAWRLVEEVGAAASAVTTSAAASVRERRAAADRTAVVVAGPRASMLLLSALPLAGPAAALLVGLPPGRLYDSSASRLLGAAGLLLTAAGWWWARGLLRRARRPGRTGAPT
jgi:tight adherence protein B